MNAAVGDIHLGRSWFGHEIEDGCPCPKAPCGLVLGFGSVDCPEHDPAYAKTMRQGHPSENCPAS